MDPARLLRDLSDPRAYPFPVDDIVRRETHISRLFFAGDRVYKVKKSVAFEFLDFRHLEERRHFCHEEVRLNRRLAPDVYLGVVEIEPDRDGRLRVGGRDDSASPPNPAAIEYAVEMRRLPADRMLDRLLDVEEVPVDAVAGLVDRLVRFHQEAPTGPQVDRFGTPEAVSRLVRTNLDELASFIGFEVGLPENIFRLVRSFLENELVVQAAVLAQRVTDHRIRDGHGDLHTGNICFTDDGVVIYDCIEFNPALRACDVARDIAFLVMDLDHRERRDLAEFVVARYAERAGDRDLSTLLPLYKTHLAGVRGKVCALAAQTSSADSTMTETARAYFHLMAGYAMPPSLIVFSGLPGVGKSSLARRLAAPLDAVVVRSDVVRKRSHGLEPTERPHGKAAEALYTQEATLETYETLRGEAARQLESGRSVVIDAACSTRGLRDKLLDAARGRPWTLLHVTAPDDVVRTRLRDRAFDRTEASDAGIDWYEQAKTQFEPPDEVPEAHLVEWSSVMDVGDGVTAGLECLARQTRLGGSQGSRRPAG